MNTCIIQPAITAASCRRRVVHPSAVTTVRTDRPSPDPPPLVRSESMPSVVIAARYIIRTPDSFTAPQTRCPVLNHHRSKPIYRESIMTCSMCRLSRLFGRRDTKRVRVADQPCIPVVPHSPPSPACDIASSKPSYGISASDKRSVTVSC